MSRAVDRRLSLPPAGSIELREILFFFAVFDCEHLIENSNVHKAHMHMYVRVYIHMQKNVRSANQSVAEK